jgi:4-hydroxybenzoate polyprenyltransferase
MKVKTKLWAYAEWLRLSNLPTCFSNVLVGAALAELSWSRVAAHAVGISALYLAGMALNDLIDKDHDKQSRPQRPIPSGRIGRREALTVITILFLLGLVIYGILFRQVLWMVCVLVLLIILYDILHKKWSGSVLLMGACRSMIYLIVGLAGTSVDSDAKLTTPLVLLAAIIGIYIVSLTAIARIEDESVMDYRKWLAVAIPLMVLAVAFYQPPVHLFTTLFVGVILLAWFGRAAMGLWKPLPQTKKAVLYWLAGICLVDTYFLSLLNRPSLVLCAGLCFVATVWGHRRVSGT